MSDSNGAVAYALGTNVAVAAAKLVVGLAIQSPAMLSEAAHSAIDCSTQGLLLAGEKHSEHRDGIEHRYGIAAAAIMLVSGGLAGVWQGIGALSSGESITSRAAIIGLVVLAGASVAEALSCARALRNLAASRSGVSWFRHLRTTDDTNSKSIVVEDGSDVLGNALAAAGIAASWLTGNPVWDAVAAIAVGSLLVVLSSELGMHNARCLRTA